MSELASYPDYPFSPKRFDRGKGIGLSYLDEGPADADPVLMLHGNPSWSYYWRHLVAGLRDGYRCIVPDHIGMGLSDKPDDGAYTYTLQSRVDDLDRLVDSLGLTRKITLAVANIIHGRQDCLFLGNLSSQRDWGYAPDFVQCMWLILQHHQPDDFVIATGKMYTVREFCTHAFRRAGIELEWRGVGADEKGIDPKSGKTLVAVDPRYFRPTEVEQLLGNPAKAIRELGWDPQQTSFEQLVHKMVDSDLKLVAHKHR